MKTIILFIVLINFPYNAQTAKYGEETGIEWSQFHDDAEKRFSEVDWSNKQE